MFKKEEKDMIWPGPIQARLSGGIGVVKSYEKSVTESE
jgi:hypothetical protein